MLSSHFFWTLGLWTYHPGVTREEGRTGFLHLPSACGACLNFRREKDSAVPFLVDRESNCLLAI